MRRYLPSICPNRKKIQKQLLGARECKIRSYPNKPLCPENEGYVTGTIRYRTIGLFRSQSMIPLGIPVFVCSHNEHCIVFNCQHTPMKIERNAFIKLFDFVNRFRIISFGSNADSPIVGGSILSHDHFCRVDII